MPGGDVSSPLITDNRDGTVKLMYEPQVEGLHELQVCYNGENVQGSPYKFFVDSLANGKITAHGAGLVHGITGEQSVFTISSKNVGAGSLSLAVEGPCKAEISCHDNKDGTVTASYLPTSPGDYKVAVKFADKHIRGSPYTAKVTGEGRKKNQISVGSQSEVPFPGKVADSEIHVLNAAIQAPSGLEEPCFIKKLPDGKVGISFTPREKGQHWVSIKKQGSDITGSPFKISVAPNDVGDASMVMVSGPGLKSGKTQVDNTFTVDTRKAGYGGLSLSIEGPSKAEINCKDNADGTLAISYKPTEPGFYIINLKFADNLVSESPYVVNVTGAGSNRQTERIHRQREAAPLTEVGSQCRLTFKLPGISSYDLSSMVTSPKGISEAAETMELEDGLFGVNFVPKELGVHTVSVKYMDAHIPGSPFQFTVGPLKDGGAHRVHAGGPGLERGEINQASEFNVWTREAGAGNLAISVEGPSKAIIDFNDRKDGSCYAAYTVSESGEYRVGIKFNDKHIPDSPFKVFVTPALGDARMIEVAQFPDQGVKNNKAQNCLILRNGAKGDIECKLVTPSGKEDDVFMDKLDPEVHAIRFVPRSEGVHYFHVKCNGIQIPNSPFRLRVGEEEADPAACTASGNGLKKLDVGTKADFLVDTCAAGAGTLGIRVDGPAKVAMDCTEAEDGYKVRYTPLVNGDYYVHVKYNNTHISGSPWKVNCTGHSKAEGVHGMLESSEVTVQTVQKVSIKKDDHQQGGMPQFHSDATKVTARGLGLKKAHPGRLNNFTVNASQAGGNILYVGVYGPKGPCEEVSIKHQGHYNYAVSYMVKDRGEHGLIIKWGDDHIPGSPFNISN